MSGDGGPKDEGTLDTGIAAPTPVTPPTRVPVSGLDATLPPSATGGPATSPPVIATRQDDYPELTAVDPRHYVIGREIATAVELQLDLAETLVRMARAHGPGERAQAAALVDRALAIYDGLQANGKLPERHVPEVREARKLLSALRR